MCATFCATINVLHSFEGARAPRELPRCLQNTMQKHAHTDVERQDTREVLHMPQVCLFQQFPTHFLGQQPFFVFAGDVGRHAQFYNIRRLPQVLRGVRQVEFHRYPSLRKQAVELFTISYL